jgi:hypothetical protein
MQRLTERDQIRNVAKTWREQYPKGSTYPKAESVYRALQALDPDVATAADVEAIIGSWTWVTPQKCDECGTRSWGVVQVGQPPDHDSNTCNLCGDCLSAALALLTPTPEAHDGE